MNGAVAVLLASLTAAPAFAAGFGNTSMGKKPYGVLILAYDTGGAWKTELGHIRSELKGVAVESVESAGEGIAIQRALDRLKSQHVDKVVAIPLELISESPVMDELRYLFGIRAALGLYQFPTREQRVERAFTAWVAEHSNSINPDQARMLHLLHNVVLASVRETKYTTIDTAIFSRAPFTLLGGRTRMESIFGREQLSSILQELNTLISAA